MVHLAAFNTPQFDWGRTTLPRQPRPMGRIFQPEVAARAVVWAATHRRRDVWVGWPAVLAILGNRFVPGWLDRRLARTAVSGQMTDAATAPDRPDNLYAPVAGPFGAHGRFDASAHARSGQLWLTTHRKAAAALAVAVGVLAWSALRGARLPRGGR